jgi:Predicted ATPase
MEEKLTSLMQEADQLQSTEIKQPTKQYSWDDTGNRDRFIDKYGDKFLYDAKKKRVYFYDGKVWKLDKAMSLSRYFDYIIEDISKTPIVIPQDASAQGRKIYQESI